MRENGQAGTGSPHPDPLPAGAPGEGEGKPARMGMGDRMILLRETLEARFTKLELALLLSDQLLRHAIHGFGDLLDEIDKAEAELIEDNKGLKKLARLIARSRRGRRLLDRLDAGEIGKPKRRRRKRKAVR